MKKVGYIWKIIINIITLIVVSAIFSAATTKFETIVFAILVLIYLNTAGFMAVWALNHIEFSEAVNNEFKDIKKLLGFKSDGKGEDEEDYTEEYKEEMKKEKEDAKRNMMIKFYINIGFQFIIYVIALYNLITALNSY